MAPAEPHRSRRREPLDLNRRLKFETGFHGPPDEFLRLGVGDKNNRIGIGSGAGFADGDDCEPADDEVANALLLEKGKSKPAEIVETAC